MFPNIEENNTLFVYYSNKNCHGMLLNSQFSSTNLSYELLFSKYDNEVELESDNANQNQNSTISSFFAASNQEFMQ